MLTVTVPLVFIKDVVVPRYNDLKFRLWNCYYFFTNLKAVCLSYLRLFILPYILHTKFDVSLITQLVNNLPAMWRPGFNPWVGKFPWGREQLPTPVLWPGEFHGLFHGVTKSRTWLSSFHFTSLLLVTSEAETCVMGFLNTMTSGAVLDQHLLSYK